MELWLKILLFCTFLIICIQDIKERKVYWFLFPIIALCCGVLHYKNSTSAFFLNTLLINSGIIVFLLLVVVLYSKFKLKTTFQNTLGWGDILLFIALIFSFATVSFIVLFVFSLIFSLLLHLFLKRKSDITTVPLAGYMSLFFAMTYATHWLGYIDLLYII